MTAPRPLRRRTLWLGFAAVLLPLAVLLVLQYRWLVKLEQASAAADQAALTNYLEAVTEKVQGIYTWNAQRTLDLPAYLFTEGRLEDAAAYFRKKRPEGVRLLFVASFVGEQAGRTLYFNPACASWEPPHRSAEARAVYVAASSWHTLAKKKGVLETVAPAVDERDPDNRVVLYPVTDRASRVVGVAGMILDEDHLRTTVLPQVVGGALPKFFPEERGGGRNGGLGGGRLSPVVWVRDGRGRTVFSTRPQASGAPGPAEVERPLRFAFTDWRVGLASRHPTPGDWARSNFHLNVGLSAVLAAVLLGGVVLALRTASREMMLSQMKSDFVSNVSHELRTPLASIRVFGELLRLGRVDREEKVREYGEYIETESRRLTQLINNLLDFSHIESGRKSYRLQATDLVDLVEETLRTFEIRLRQSGFRVHWQGARDPLPRLRLDPSAIGHALGNLLDNAVKYSGDGREIAVRLARTDATGRDTATGDWLSLSVRDWGVGVPRDEQEKIFDRFHRVSTGLVHDVKGSGLGLAIVRHVMEAHGGRVAVESRPGQGSTFTLRLPLAELAVGAARPRPEGGPPAPAPPDEAASGSLPLLEGPHERPSEA